MASKPKPVESEPAEHAVPRYDDLTIYRGTAIESMTEEQLRATLRNLLAAFREIAGAQSDRQRQRIIERLEL